MTDTRTFKTIACDRASGRVRIFYGWHSAIHHSRAIAWLRAIQ